MYHWATVALASTMLFPATNAALLPVTLVADAALSTPTTVVHCANGTLEVVSVVCFGFRHFGFSVLGSLNTMPWQRGIEWAGTEAVLLNSCAGLAEQG
jgi:hypothetical protein